MRKEQRGIFQYTHRPSYITTSSVQNVLLTTGSLDKQSQVSYPLDQEGAILLRSEAAHSVWENTDVVILTQKPTAFMSSKVL